MRTGRDLFMELYLTIENNQTTRLWAENATIYTPEEKVFDAIQLVFDSIVVGDVLVTGYFDKEQDEKDDCVDRMSGHYYIELA